MGWLNRLRGKIVGLDSAPLIYYIEEHATFMSLVEPFFEAMARGDFEVVTSTLTVTEVMVHPIRNKNDALATAYREILLNAAHVRTMPVSAEIAEIASRLRAAHNIRTPDAIQVATAIAMRADFFLTNDAALSILPKPTVLTLGALSE